LQAIEEVLKENQQLRYQSENPAREIEALRREVLKLRKLLASSEALRHRGQQALQELREEFETLHFELTQTSAE
jgi:Mg2+ and Co2+ transporter CorA